jgi:hypothetical protein
MVTLTALLAVLVMLVPGYAWVLVSGLHRLLSALEKVVLSFVLSLCFSSLLTAALTFVTADYLFVSVEISIVAAVLVIGLYLAKQHTHFSKPRRIPLSTGSRALDFAILVYAILISGLFWSAPYYPTAQAPDLLTHTLVANAIINGDGRSTLLTAGFPLGLHFVAATISTLIDVGALQTLRIVVSAALMAAVPLVYMSARELLGDPKAAGMTVLVAAFALPVDALHLVRIGTFPNLMSDAIILAVVWLAFRYVRRPSRSLGVTLTLLGLGGTFMHSSFLMLLAVLWVGVPLVFILFRDGARDFLGATVYSSVGLVLFAVLAFFSFQANVQRIIQLYFLVGGGSAWRIASAEFVRSVLNFLGPVNAIALLCSGVFVFKYRRNLGLAFSLLWVLLMVPGAFLSGQEYRFILFAMLPGAYLVGGMLARAPHLLGDLNGTPLSKFAKVAVTLLFVLLTVSGAFPSIAVASFNPSGRNYQSAVYDSMLWLEQTNCSEGAASVGLWPDYEYLPALSGVPYAGDFNRPPDYVLQKSASLGFRCLVVSKGNQHFQQFNNNSEFEKEYQNELTTIFTIRDGRARLQGLSTDVQMFPSSYTKSILRPYWRSIQPWSST